MKTNTREITYTAILLAIGVMLPRFVNIIPIPNLASILSPMHIPVLICGFLVSWKYAGLLGLMLPLVAFLINGMPPIFPVGISMMAELATYGIAAALLFKYTRGRILISLIGAMLLGRIVMGIMNTILLGFAGVPYGLEVFLASAFINMIPGIITHIIIVPLIVKALIRARLSIHRPNIARL